MGDIGRISSSFPVAEGDPRQGGRVDGRFAVQRHAAVATDDDGGRQGRDGEGGHGVG